MFTFERVIFNISCTPQSSREAIIRGIKWNGEHGGGGVRLEKGEEQHLDQGGGGLVAQWQQPPQLDPQGAVSEMHYHFLHLTFDKDLKRPSRSIVWHFGSQVQFENLYLKALPLVFSFSSAPLPSNTRVRWFPSPWKSSSLTCLT